MRNDIDDNMDRDGDGRGGKAGRTLPVVKPFPLKCSLRSTTRARKCSSRS